MVFSVIILINFLILMDGEAIKILGESNLFYAKMIIQIISVILGIFMLFFIWYASIVFLKNRKKEIGLFIFMGVDLKTVGKLYFLEMMLIGGAASVIGIGIGILLSKFFQMIVFAIAGFQVEVKFTVTVHSVINTFILFMAIFLVISIKGFLNIARSKVVELLNDSKKSEKMPKITWFTYCIGAVSVACILYGYYLVYSTRVNAFKTLILVCVGTYGLFYAAIPAAFSFMVNNKKLLYKGENIITINSLAYRIKKNYTTYATIGILTACTVTVLGTSVSMRYLYAMSAENDQLYSISISSKQEFESGKMESIILDYTGAPKYKLEQGVLTANKTQKEVGPFEQEEYNILTYENFKEILSINGYEEDLEKVNDSMVEGNQVIYIQRPGTLASLVRDKVITINDKEYKISKDDFRFKVLGSLLNKPTIIVNQANYEVIKQQGDLVHFYGVKLEDDNQLLDQTMMDKLGKELEQFGTDDMKIQVGIYATQNVEWLKLVYAIGTFLFLVFVLAEASIIYIKVYGDASEDQEKFKILKNIGASKQELRKAIRKEVALFYILPLTVGLLHSFFAIQVLGIFISENLTGTFVTSVIVSCSIFLVSAIISAKSFQNIVKV